MRRTAQSSPGESGKADWRPSAHAPMVAPSDYLRAAASQDVPHMDEIDGANHSAGPLSDGWSASAIWPQILPDRAGSSPGMIFVEN